MKVRKLKDGWVKVELSTGPVDVEVRVSTDDRGERVTWVKLSPEVVKKVVECAE